MVSAGDGFFVNAHWTTYGQVAGLEAGLKRAVLGDGSREFHVCLGYQPELSLGLKNHNLKGAMILVRVHKPVLAWFMSP
jgi:hypothetical protein